MNGYLVPANAKRGTLIFNVFRPFDLILFGAGLFVSLFSLVIVNSSDTAMLIISCLPAGITGLLVIPIPNYHNVLCAIQSIFRFFIERRNYIWKGWCFYEKFGNEEQKK
ncbi:MAG: hypothetical protein IJZ46_04245 [Bacilli bacterium]|nr:hypothetical protein [Bacilli bacterium]